MLDYSLARGHDMGKRPFFALFLFWFFVAYHAVTSETAKEEHCVLAAHKPRGEPDKLFRDDPRNIPLGDCHPQIQRETLREILGGETLLGDRSGD